MRIGCFMIKFLISSLLFVALTGCFHDSDDDPVKDDFLQDFGGDTAKSDSPRDTQPLVQAGDLSAQISNNSDFALKIFQNMVSGSSQENKNIVFSPFSISQAMVMLSAGAANNTLEEINQGLMLNTDQAILHPSFNQLDLDFTSRAGTYTRSDNSQGELLLNISNALWGQTGYEFEGPFLDVLAINHGAGINLLNFTDDAELARTEINQWVATQTKDKIIDAMPPNSVNSDTRLVLTNTVYLKADWLSPFSVASTSDLEFNKLDASIVTVPFMSQRGVFAYKEEAGVIVVELPFVGDKLEMVLVMPDSVDFETYESTLTQAILNSLILSLQSTDVRLTMPKFNFKSEVSLKTELQSLGVIDAFNEGVADFSAMDGTTNLFVQSAIHKAFITVEESGVEAGAFTGISIGTTSAPPSIVINKPFLFMIRDKVNGSILFLGRVLDPSA